MPQEDLRNSGGSLINIISPVHFKPTNTLRQKLVHPKDNENEWHSKRRVNYWGQDSAVHLRLKEENNSFEDENVNISAREDSWFKRRVKESICVKIPSLNRGGGLKQYLSPTYNATYNEFST